MAWLLKAFPSRKIVAPLAAIWLLVIGCSGDAASNNQTMAEARNEPVASQRVASSAQEQGSAVPATDESDRLSLQTAEAACQSGDPNAFFDAFIQSKAVQKKYSAPSIEYVLLRPDLTVNRWDEIKAVDYDNFPIMMVDYYRKSAQPISQSRDEHVVIELNQGQNESFVVEWTRVIYDGKSEGGDDLGTAYTLDGKPFSKGGLSTDGELFFEATSDCWRLATDTRHHQSYAEK